MLGGEAVDKAARILQKSCSILAVKHDEVSSFHLDNEFKLLENKLDYTSLEISPDNAISVCIM